MKPDKQAQLRKAQEWLEINNRDYRNGTLPRSEWVAENRRLVEWCRERCLGITLPDFALADPAEGLGMYGGANALKPEEE